MWRGAGCGRHSNIVECVRRSSQIALQLEHLSRIGDGYSVVPDSKAWAGHWGQRRKEGMCIRTARLNEFMSPNEGLFWSDDEQDRFLFSVSSLARLLHLLVDVLGVEMSVIEFTRMFRMDFEKSWLRKICDWNIVNCIKIGHNDFVERETDGARHWDGVFSVLRGKFRNQLQNLQWIDSIVSSWNLQDEIWYLSKWIHSCDPRSLRWNDHVTETGESRVDLFQMEAICLSRLNRTSSPFTFFLCFIALDSMLHVTLVRRDVPSSFREWGVGHFGRQHPSQRPPHLRDNWNLHPGILRREQVHEFAVTTPSAERYLHHCSPGARWCKPQTSFITLKTKVCRPVSRRLSVTERGVLL